MSVNLFALFLQVSWTVRAVLMTVLAFCVGLPLSLMRNLHSLASFSACSLLFYAGFVLQVGPEELSSNVYCSTVCKEFTSSMMKPCNELWVDATYSCVCVVCELDPTSTDPKLNSSPSHSPLCFWTRHMWHTQYLSSSKSINVCQWIVVESCHWVLKITSINNNRL